MKNAILVPLALLLGFSILGCQKPATGVAGIEVSQTATHAPVAVQVLTVQPGDFVEYGEYYGQTGGWTEKTLQQSIQGAELEIESLVLQLQKAQASLEVLQLNVQLAEKAYEMAERGFATGALEPLQLEDADNQLSNARHQVLQEKYSYITTLLDLEYAVNQSLL